LTTLEVDASCPVALSKKKKNVGNDVNVKIKETCHLTGRVRKHMVTEY